MSASSVEEDSDCLMPAVSREPRAACSSVGMDPSKDGFGECCARLSTACFHCENMSAGKLGWSGLREWNNEYGAQQSMKRDVEIVVVSTTTARAVRAETPAFRGRFSA